MNIGDSFSLGNLASNSFSDKSVNQAQNLSQRASGNSSETSVETAAREFERLLSTMMVKQMRSTLKDGFFPSGPGNDAYNAWFDESIGQSLADSGAMDLLGQLKAQFGSVEAVNETPAGAGKENK